MPSILISGPAGSAKSQLARDLLREATEPTVAADFQSIVAALLLQERGPDGKYPAAAGLGPCRLPSTSARPRNYRAARQSEGLAS